MRSIVFVAAILTLPASASAAPPRPWLCVTGSWGTYSMSDVNNEIGAINAVLDSVGLSMDEIRGGFGFGIAVGVDIPDRVSIGLGYERLSASTEVGDLSGSLRYHLPANVVRVSVEYRIPTERSYGGSVGFGVGLVKEAGSIDLVVTGVGAVAADLDGSGPLLDASVGGDWWMASQFALVGSAGFRYAKVREIRIEGQTIYNADGSKYSVDYSGVVVRLGLKAALAR